MQCPLLQLSGLSREFVYQRVECRHDILGILIVSARCGRNDAAFNERGRATAHVMEGEKHRTVEQKRKQHK